LVEIVPPDEPLQPALLTLQLTAVLEVAVTPAVKGCVPELVIEALAGLMLNKIAAAATIVALVEADLVKYVTLVAATITVAGEEILADGTYSPSAGIVPHAAPPQAAALKSPGHGSIRSPHHTGNNC